MSRSRVQVEREGRLQRLAPFQQTATRIAVGLVIAGPVLGMAAGLLGALEVYPYDYAVPVALTVMCSLIGLALLIGACGGLYIMAGAKVAPFGVVFVAGFGLLVLGLVTGSVLYRDLGVLGLAVSGAIFYVAGRVTGTAPPSATDRWGHPVAIVVGAALAVVGHLLNVWWLLLIGAMAVGCGAGTVVGRWWLRRRRRQGG